MLPLVSRRMPSVTGWFSGAKKAIFCGRPSSRRVKSDALQASHVVALVGDADAQVDQVDVGMKYRLLLGEQVRAEQEERMSRDSYGATETP
jgi:hypothetical protein